ncbi:putative tyrosine phosphatase family protein [Linderina pennispora]|uniref:Putative tyrosine-protein phosphatase OCA1 n=1 Tax=Linderina pennispora TaxID=61395 RepID=A0A1Y1VZD3_9FUNG|nr:putative tyrosine phosphatase family protein [Linderina pennispora]ORX66376.1 putative tyrosine phosphatase family protein [Linderina pennispora]
MGRTAYQHYIPPVNFGYVENDLYRCGQPNELNFPFMEKLGLRCIQLHHLGVLESGNASDPITEDTILEAFNLILDKANHPMAIMCNIGRHRTGTVVGCLRKLQRWNLASIFEEYRRFAGPKVRMLNEQFIELFDTDLVRIPGDPPEWL